MFFHISEIVCLNFHIFLSPFRFLKIVIYKSKIILKINFSCCFLIFIYICRRIFPVDVKNTILK